VYNATTTTKVLERSSLGSNVERFVPKKTANLKPQDQFYKTLFTFITKNVGWHLKLVEKVLPWPK
jgi:hypothetical protein